MGEEILDFGPVEDKMQGIIKVIGVSCSALYCSNSSSHAPIGQSK